MKIISLMLTLLSFLSIVAITNAKGDKVAGQKCTICKEFVDNFSKGLDRTKKSNYGGGNTNWEESRLGQYANSEVRLVEIMENVCEGASRECPSMVEENEEIIDAYWFNKEMKKERSELFNHFCIKSVKACCPNNTFGPSCTECPGGLERPCKNNGKCDGEGTREGTGKCTCSVGYKGELCDSCGDGHYEAQKNDTHTLCRVCHKSCEKSCTGDSRKDCDACKEGWVQTKEEGCKDVNECDQVPWPCDERKYCTNTEGSFSCLACDAACASCHGDGFDKCIRCSPGYLLNVTECLDIDECRSDGSEDLCTLEGQKCMNTPGSYKCICQSGYIKDGDGCKVKPAEKPKTEEKKDQDPSQIDPTSQIMIAIPAFLGIAIIFIVITSTAYLVNPFLASVPIAVFAAILYYLISQY